MRKLKFIAQVSLDGIMQAPGGPDEEPGYPYGGWVVPYFDAAIGEAIDTAQGEYFDLLLGRRTYDIFARYWPRQSGPMARRLNAATKYVATHRAEDLVWGPAEALGPDIAQGVVAVKSRRGQDLIVWGSSTLAPVLIEAGLVDEIFLLVYPVLLGQGKRVFRDDVSARELALVSSNTTAKGVLINHYRPRGPLRTGSFARPPV